jgi:dimethylamine/trimethylamine dehydrogenase
MVAAITSGQLDVIGAARPSISDPFLPRKIQEGRLDEIRECIGCNACAARFNFAGGRVACTQNATFGEEFRRGWHPERFTRASNADMSVLVVGAGPAGLECARVLGERGMSAVHVVDAERQVGGAMRWISGLPGLAEWGRVVGYRQSHCERLKNVQIITGRRLSSGDVLTYGAELVVVATGSRWATDGMGAATHRPVDGADPSLPWVLTPEQLIVEGKRSPGDHVLVYDTDGYFMGATLAEKLARDGHRVTVVTSFSEVGPYMDYTGERIYMERTLHQLGVEIVTSHVLDRITPDGAEGHHTVVGERRSEWAADATMLVTQRRSADDLYHNLCANRERAADEGIEGIYRVGDCHVPLMVLDAVFSGHRLAREIDSDDPSAPLPFIRENRVVDAARRSAGWPAVSRD